MDLISEIQSMYFCENLTIGEIAGALRLDPNYVYEIIYKRERIVDL